MGLSTECLRDSCNISMKMKSRMKELLSLSTSLLNTYHSMEIGTKGKSQRLYLASGFVNEILYVTLHYNLCYNS